MRINLVIKLIVAFNFELFPGYSYESSLHFNEAGHSVLIGASTEGKQRIVKT